MKIALLSLKYIVIIMICFFTSCMSKKANSQDSIIKFEKNIYDLGEVKKGKSRDVFFKFSNIGKKEIVLEYVTSTCGCTLPKWSKEKIKPQDKDSIKVIFNAKYLGNFNEVITVFYSGKESPENLNIIGKVVKN